jgi:hypothetical protein
MAWPKPKPTGDYPDATQLPGSSAPLVMEEFQGLYTSTSRVGVKDEQCWWIDGLMPFGRMMLRTLYGTGGAVWTAPVTIAFFDFANIGSNPISIAVLTDGSIYQVVTGTGVGTLIAAAGTITNPSRENVGISQSGDQYVLIVAKQTNGYFIWDGTTFYIPGGPSPGGSTMPTAIGGTAVETYQGRVWIADGPSITFSAPGSVEDFTTGNGGGNFTSTDPFLRVAYTALKQTNGFLYLIADSSINYISGVQTSGSPPVTTFTNQNADPEVGTPYSATVDVLSRNIVFANAWGAHVSYGAAVTKISEALDGFYASVPNFAGQQLSAAKAIIFSKRIWMILVPVIDLFSGQQRNKLLMWDGQRWWTSEQEVPLTYIQHQEINSVITAWGTDGSTLRRLFQSPSASFTKRVMSKFWATPIGMQVLKTSNEFWLMAQYFNLDSPDITLYVESENAAASHGNAVKTLTPDSANSLMNWTTLGGTAMHWTTGGEDMVWEAIGAGIVVFDVEAVAQKGVLVGFSLETNSPDVAFISSNMGVIAAAYRGK